MATIEPTYVGLDVSLVTTSRTHELGTVVDVGNTRYMYVQTTTNALTQFALVYVNESNVAVAGVTTTIAAAPYPIGAPQVAIAANSFGWIAVGGVFTANIAASVTAPALLYTSATAGQATGTAGSNVVLRGLRLTTTSVGAGSYTVLGSASILIAG